MSQCNVTIDPRVRKKIEKALKTQPLKKEKVNNALETLRNHGPEYPSLQTHTFHGIRNLHAPMYNQTNNT